MSALDALLNQTRHPMRDAFIGWQCRVRQIAMRDGQGRPDDAIMPEVRVDGQALGHIITVLNKVPGHEVVAELEHMARKTNDPAQIRDNAIRFLSATYYQKAREFSDILTATFPPDSPGASKIRRAGKCTLRFQAYAQAFDLSCKIWRLTQKNPLHRATMAHNRLFNPALPPDTVVLGFEPDWEASTSGT